MAISLRSMLWESLFRAGFSPEQIERLLRKKDSVWDGVRSQLGYLLDVLALVFRDSLEEGEEPTPGALECMIRFCGVLMRPEDVPEEEETEEDTEEEPEAPPVPPRTHLLSPAEETDRAAPLTQAASEAEPPEEEEEVKAEDVPQIPPSTSSSSTVPEEEPQWLQELVALKNLMEEGREELCYEVAYEVYGEVAQTAPASPVFPRPSSLQSPREESDSSIEVLQVVAGVKAEDPVKVEEAAVPLPPRRRKRRPFP
jgi:hypothetical protein